MAVPKSLFLMAAALVLWAASAGGHEIAASCRNIVDPPLRLQCFDGAYRPQPPVQAPAYVPYDQYPAPQPPVTSGGFDDFGSDAISGRKPLDAIRVRIVQLETRSKKSYITTASNQVWRQTDSQRPLRFKDGAANYNAIIRRTTFGAYKMSVPGLSRAILVKRIR